jgi:prolyl-tRNA editing enzyme YbaK/EbsC (Cys-tRNA(Pro) deacylase)
LQRVDADAVRELTGFSIGGVAPFGSLTPLATLMDSDLMGFQIVWAAASRPTAVFSIQPGALAKATKAEIVKVSS